MATYRVKRYMVYLGKLKLVTQEEDDTIIVEVVGGIRCSCSGKLLDIGFIPEGEPLPPNTVSPLNTCFRPISEFSYYLDLLRNEKPIWIVIDEEVPHNHGIKTDFEGVGEGEVPK
jgi:hypothetical protein